MKCNACIRNTLFSFPYHDSNEERDYCRMNNFLWKEADSFLLLLNDEEVLICPRHKYSHGMKECERRTPPAI